ncbi:uncharacterized protein LOC135367162 isoform X2 [Ornithodoros turicata]|uniref:uncharacterized protein LOC135367162 isoform X2 n=1 Tax=Ornithodoros turicata TaxID=34597 RepID=UPI003138DC98
MENSQAPKVTSAVPCDFFNFTDRTCWLYQSGGGNILLRVRIADEDIPRDRLQVHWKRKYKIRNQNLYAVESIREKDTMDDEQRDILTLELRPAGNEDMYFNKIEALVLVMQKQVSGRTRPLPYGDITFIIDMNPIKVRQRDGEDNISINIEEYVQLPNKDVIIDWKQQLSRLRYTDVQKNFEVLMNGKLLIAKDYTNKMTIACIIYYKDGRFYAKRSFLLSGRGNQKHERTRINQGVTRRHATRATASRAPSTTPTHSTDTSIRDDTTTVDDQNDYEVNMVVHIDKSGDDAKDDEDDYTLVQTNVSVIDAKGKPQGTVVESKRVTGKTVVLKNGLCFHVIRDSGGRATMVPCVQTPPIRHRTRSTLRSTSEKPRAKEPDYLRSGTNKVQTCRTDSECSIHGYCNVDSEKGTEGRCICHPGYLGNGLFCWETFFS